MALKQVLLDERKGLADEYQTTESGREAEGALAADVEATQDKRWTRIEEINVLEQRDAELEARNAKLKALDTELQPRATQTDPTDGVPGTEDPERDTEAEKAWGVRAQPEYRKEYRRYLRSDADARHKDSQRALSAGTDTAGGLLVPKEFATDLIKAVDNLVFMRQFATVMSLAKAESIGIPTLETDMSDSDWTTEIASASEDTSMAFGKRELYPHPCSKLAKVSRTLLRLSVIDVEALIRDRMAYKRGVTEEKGFMTGTGAQTPLGVFTAHDSGISTSRDVSTGNTTTEIRFDGLIECQYKLKAQYWNAARWIFHRDGVKQIAKLKDGEGQYIWRPALAGGQPSTILNAPYHMSEYAPSTFTTGLYVGLYGDFRWYWIADALDISIQVLYEKYALTNQTGFIMRFETDGMPVLEEAFARVTLA